MFTTYSKSYAIFDMEIPTKKLFSSYTPAQIYCFVSNDWFLIKMSLIFEGYYFSFYVMNHFSTIVTLIKEDVFGKI